MKEWEVQDEIEIRERTKRVLGEAIYPFLEMWYRPIPDLRGTMNDACYVERQAFRDSVESADEAWAVRVSCSAGGFAAQRGGTLAVRRKGSVV